MKKLLSLAVAVFALFGLSSCCCMFGSLSKAEYIETQVPSKWCHNKTVVEEVVMVDAKGGMSKSGMTRTVTREVPKYVTKREKVPCNNCWRLYCPDTECCGTTGKKVRTMASAQGWSGSPHIGLVPTMKPIVP